MRTPRTPIKPLCAPLGLGALLLAGLLGAQPALADNARMTVQIDGLRDDSGNLRVSLYREPDSFRKEDRAFKLLSQPARKGKTSLVFDDIPPGRYALMAYHDANDDNKLNLRFGMFPQEGYALSNNPQVVGPPRFNDSAFDFPAADGAPINLQITY